MFISRPKNRIVKISPDLSKLEIDVNIDDRVTSIRVLRPVRARDALTVEFDETTILTVLKYIRDAGFTDAKQHAKKTHTDFPSGLKGVWARGGKWTVLCNLTNGCTAYKSASSLEEAADLQSRAEAGELLEDVENTNDPMADAQAPAAGADDEKEDDK